MTDNEQELLKRIEESVQAMCKRAAPNVKELEAKLQKMCDQAYADGVVAEKLVVEAKMDERHGLDVAITRVLA